MYIVHSSSYCRRLTQRFNRLFLLAKVITMLFLLAKALQFYHIGLGCFLLAKFPTKFFYLTQFTMFFLLAKQHELTHRWLHFFVNLLLWPILTEEFKFHWRLNLTLSWLHLFMNHFHTHSFWIWHWVEQFELNSGLIVITESWTILTCLRVRFPGRHV